MTYPINYIGITNNYHQKYSIDFGWNSNHGGQHQPIYSIDNGKIYKIVKQFKGGNVLYIKHDNGYMSEYAHLQDKSIVLKVGQKVKKGQQVANMGDTGASASGCHLHFSLYKSTKIKDSNKLPCLDYLFVGDDQLIGENTQEKYNLLKYGQTMVCTTKSLRVRNKPSLTGKTLGYLNLGDEVKVYERLGDWYRLSSTLNKWSSSKYLKGVR